MPQRPARRKGPQYQVRPLLIDLCCGKGGWAAGFLAAGYDVRGYDIAAQPDYPGEFVQADVRELDGRDLRGAAVIVASPPCEEFSRHDMPWLKRRNPPEPDLSVVAACWRIAWDARAPIVLENVRGAQRWLGRARAHVGPFYLWGDVPPVLPRVEWRHKESMSSDRRLERAVIPFELAVAIAEYFAPAKRLERAA